MLFVFTAGAMDSVRNSGASQTWYGPGPPAIKCRPILVTAFLKICSPQVSFVGL